MVLLVQIVTGIKYHLSTIISSFVSFADVLAAHLYHSRVMTTSTAIGDHLSAGEVFQEHIREIEVSKVTNYSIIYRY